MEWLIGVVLGGVIGFVSALVVTEYTAWRERGLRKDHIAKLLKDEIASNKGLLAVVQEGLAAAKAAGEWKPHLHVPFRREIFGACVNDLALLPHPTRQSIQLLYSNLAGLDFVQDEGYLRQALFPPSDEHSEEKVLKWVQAQLEQGLSKALAEAEEALAELDKLIGQV